MSGQLAPEQDRDGGDDLPTYDDLAEQHGPNSRFGRWRSWIEKRAAERYADITPEEIARRRERGWGNNPSLEPQWANQPTAFPGPEQGGSTSIPHLQVQTAFKPLPSPPIYPEEYPSAESQPLVGQPLSPTHISLHQFGSRFLPHTTYPIRTLLPLLGDKLLLIGHDNGLSVLNMFPQEWTDTGLRNKGPAEAEAHPIWEGEGVYQLSIVECEDIGESIPQGVVLALVGSESEHSKDPDGVRSLRMYNLASLISLAKWAVSQKGAHPLDLRRPANWSPQQTQHKKHKSHGSLAKGLKSLMTDSQSQGPSPISSEPSSYNNLLPSGSGSSIFDKRYPQIQRRGSAESGWDVVEDLPLRWATDYVALASAGSRLVNSSVLSYDLWREDRRARGGALLAVATKSNILLYESPRGERAFRFVKDFYTPLTPRSVTFVHQTVNDAMARSPSDASGIAAKHLSHPRGHMHLSPSSARHRHTSMTTKSVVFGNQLSLFVVFEKKAGLIRLADSSVGEVELYGDSHASVPPSASANSLSNRRSRVSYDGGHGFQKESKGHWTPPTRIELPLAVHQLGVSQSVELLTRGRQTHILPCPLPAALPLFPPLQTLTWQAHPSSVTPRVIYGETPILQVVALGEDGVEVQDISLAFLSNAGKGRAEEPLYAQTDLGVETGFLCAGGHWHRPYDAPLHRSVSSRSGASTSTWDSTDTEEIVARLERDQGMYGWQRKGLQDWRVVWLGGTGAGSGPGEQLGGAYD
ncbi:hypothetical protein DENSPDRAFT_831416 [Dentipellis sp. KUC8613]|nr:hypothetical protein DENSPDRAFT_831416 [Dentipellis sp. KUC8613]